MFGWPYQVRPESLALEFSALASLALESLALESLALRGRRHAEPRTQERAFVSFPGSRSRALNVDSPEERFGATHIIQSNQAGVFGAARAAARRAAYPGARFRFFSR